jgi:hypothetical protein
LSLIAAKRPSRSLSAAAKSITKYEVNGWLFWKIVIWSKNARDSKWVKKESRYALKRYKQYGSPDFRPIPVEGPPIASVPQGLQAYHFNDELLGLIRAAELDRRERERRKSRI